MKTAGRAKGKISLSNKVTVQRLHGAACMIVFNQSQHDFKTGESEFIRDRTDHVRAARYFL